MRKHNYGSFCQSELACPQDAAVSRDNHTIVARPGRGSRTRTRRSFLQSAPPAPRSASARCGHAGSGGRAPNADVGQKLGCHVPWDRLFCRSRHPKGFIVLKTLPEAIFVSAPGAVGDRLDPNLRLADDRKLEGESVMTESDNITRRSVIGSVAAGAGLWTAAGSAGIVGTARAQSAPKTFVLIHGAWHGG